MEKVPNYANPKIYQTLDELIEDPQTDVITLCSPLRSSQAEDAIKCLNGGKHVYAEKPSALTLSDLDRIITTAQKTGKIYHEMAGTALEAPYAMIREMIKEGVIGETIQIFSQKSYPWTDEAN